MKCHSKGMHRLQIVGDESRTIERISSAYLKPHKAKNDTSEESDDDGPMGNTVPSAWDYIQVPTKILKETTQSSQTFYGSDQSETAQIDENYALDSTVLNKQLYSMEVWCLLIEVRGQRRWWWIWCKFQFIVLSIQCTIGRPIILFIYHAQDTMLHFQHGEYALSKNLMCHFGLSTEHIMHMVKLHSRKCLEDILSLWMSIYIISLTSSKRSSTPTLPVHINWLKQLNWLKCWNSLWMRERCNELKICLQWLAKRKM